MFTTINRTAFPISQSAADLLCLVIQLDKQMSVTEVCDSAPPPNKKAKACGASI